MSQKCTIINVLAPRGSPANGSPVMESWLKLPHHYLINTHINLVTGEVNQGEPAKAVMQSWRQLMESWRELTHPFSVGELRPARDYGREILTKSGLQETCHEKVHSLPKGIKGLK